MQPYYLDYSVLYVHRVWHHNPTIMRRDKAYTMLWSVTPWSSHLAQRPRPGPLPLFFAQSTDIRSHLGSFILMVGAPAIVQRTETLPRELSWQLNGMEPKGKVAYQVQSIQET